MAKKIEKRLGLVAKFANVNTDIITQMRSSGKQIVRDTFKKYVDLSQMKEVEIEIGYDHRSPKGNLAKDNHMIEYWKCTFPEITGDVFIYKPSETKLYVFANK